MMKQAEQSPKVGMLMGWSCRDVSVLRAPPGAAKDPGSHLRPVWWLITV